jgi:predicted nuclease of predicted toxin-antitoxin system
MVNRRGKPPQVLWLKCPNRATIEMQLLLTKKFPEALHRLEAGEALVEINEDKS